MNSSLTYEILLYLNAFYFSMFGVTELSIGLLKIIRFPYPTGTFMFEYLLLILLCCTEGYRIFIGRKGNLTETPFSVIVSMVLSIPSILGTVYFLIWQTYVLKLEAILCGIQLVLIVLELGLATFAVSRFYRFGTY